MNRNEDKLNRPVQALRLVLSSAITKPWRIHDCFSDFRPQERQQPKKKRSGALRIWNYFSIAAHIGLCVGHGSATRRTVLIPRLWRYFNSFQRERAGHTEKPCSNWQTCRGNTEHVINVWQQRSPAATHHHQNPRFHCGKFSPFPHCQIFLNKWLFVKPPSDLCPNPILFSASMRFEGSREGELHSVWSLHACGFWFVVKSWKQGQSLVTERLL